ncbi:ATP-binding protein [Streptomyces sp. NPDC021093]|uniref:ATP-binding protein n=1 Tax=Streptomyces sp. NPDC021093 TaxID=3365112 RepID=UPI0037A0818A
MTEPSQPVDWVTANQNHLAAALELLRARLTEDPVEDRTETAPAFLHAMADPPALEVIAKAFGLSDFERDTLLACAGVELDTEVARACASAQGDPSRTYVTFSLALAKLPGPHWSAVTPTAPLRHWHLVEPARPEVPMTSPLRIDERVLHALTGIGHLDPRIQPLAEPPPEPRPLPPALEGAADRLAVHWSAAAGGVHLHGRRPADLRAVAVSACTALGLRPVCLRAGDLPAAPAEQDLLARLCERETALDGRAWLLAVDDTDPAPEGGRHALDLAVRIAAPVVVLTREPLPGAAGRTRLTSLDVPAPRPAEARTAWRAALGGVPADADDVPAAAQHLDGWLGRIAGQFDLDLAAIDAALHEVRQDLGGADAGPRLWDACRRLARLARRDLDDLTHRIEPRARWDDLVLPAPQSQTLREIALHVRHRFTVCDDWGFAARGGRGLGAAALFAGPSGTGKTLAAEVLAGALELDLYRIDLSRVVSKYIGETEKNLRRVFDAGEAGGAVLLFDEADALFGRRSEVKDSHDRYANIEVSYLLQRMENYRGLAVLTTNQKSALDSAFLRRLRFVVQFPFPDAAGRAEIWRHAFPAETPTDSLDFVRLSRLAVAGGTIHNIALSAAFLAADAGEPVGMAHLLRAARSEYTKLEQPLTDREVAGWTK